jgi:hypothetical protein
MREGRKLEVASTYLPTYLKPWPTSAQSILRYMFFDVVVFGSRWQSMPGTGLHTHAIR